MRKNKAELAGEVIGAFFLGVLLALAVTATESQPPNKSK